MFHACGKRRIQVLHNACVVPFHEKPTSNCEKGEKSNSTWKFIKQPCAGYKYNYKWSWVLVPVHYMPSSVFFFSPSLYFREYTVAIDFPCSKALVDNGRKWRHPLKNTTRVEIIITISAAIRIQKTFQPMRYFQKIIFSKSQDLDQEKLMAAVILGNKDPKIASCNVRFVRDWNFAR